MKKVKLVILFFSLLYIGSANAQQKIKKINLDVGIGINQFIPTVLDSTREIPINGINAYNRNILLRLNINLSYRWSLQLGNNFTDMQNSFESTVYKSTFTQKLKANIVTVKICNYVIDSSQIGFNAYWNLGVSFLNSSYNLSQLSPIYKDITYNGTSYLPNVGFEGAIGIRYNTPSLFGFFMEVGFNKLDDKTRAIFQSGLSFYIKNK